MTDITPPKISPDRIASLLNEMSEKLTGFKGWSWEQYARAIEAEVNRLWLERLSLAAWEARHVDPLGNDHGYVSLHRDLAIGADMHGDPVPLYRIKEQK